MKIALEIKDSEHFLILKFSNLFLALKFNIVLSEVSPSSQEDSENGSWLLCGLWRIFWNRQIVCLLPRQSKFLTLFFGWKGTPQRTGRWPLGMVNFLNLWRWSSVWFQVVVSRLGLVRTSLDDITWYLYWGNIWTLWYMENVEHLNK